MGYDYANFKTFTKSQIGGLTKSLASLRFGAGLDTGKAWDKILERAKSVGLEIDYNDANVSGEKLTFKVARKITAEQTKFGKAWLRNYFFKLDGTPRSGKRMDYISDDVLKIAKSVARFEFVGVLVVASQGFYPCQVLPIYRTYNRKGEYFDYAPIYWGQPIIMEG